MQDDWTIDIHQNLGFLISDSQWQGVRFSLVKKLLEVILYVFNTI